MCEGWPSASPLTAKPQVDSGISAVSGSVRPGSGQRDAAIDRLSGPSQTASMSDYIYEILYERPLIGRRRLDTVEWPRI